MLIAPELIRLCLPLTCLVGFLLSVSLFPFYIRYLRQRAIGQFIREEGPLSHGAKARTPTMGGVCFMFAFLIASASSLIVSVGDRAGGLFVVCVSLLAGLIGLVDDTAKLRRKANAGVSARLRLALETGLGLVLAGLLIWHGAGTDIMLGGLHSFWQLFTSALDLPALPYLLICAFFLAAATNAVNLHDGMDGLAAGTTFLVLLTLSLMLHATGQMPLAAVAAAGAGSVGGFLVFNRYPASIFMGDTGSLFLGGLTASLAVAGGLALWFIPLSLIYIVETLSVMAQVVYFKLTKDYKPETPMSYPALVWLKLTRRLPGEGKRLFRMAPLHHHFEAIAAERGWKEWRVVACFWLAQLVICLAALIAFWLL